MNIHSLFSLKEYNTFDIDVNAVYSFFCFSEDSLSEILSSDIYKTNQTLILGGGSNVLFLNDFNGLVILMQNKGIEKIHEDNEFVYIQAAAGEDWDEFVEYCVQNNYGGLENLSLIPGTVGAAPIQNIGAYGVELKDVLMETEAVNRKSGIKRIFTNVECEFGYRESIFKNELKNQYIILNVTFKLTKRHQLKLDYGRLNDELDPINNPRIKDVRDAVIRIRESKLPDPEEFPNAGSFFKNPIVPRKQFQYLKKRFPNLVSYPGGDNMIKLAAGQLIDLCDWKGKTEKGVGVFKNQALVLVNFNSASGQAIYDFSEKIKQSVFDKFGVEIEREVTVIN
jgi:UDP-N-acetylmuramate dehydrogenase